MASFASAYGYDKTAFEEGNWVIMPVTGWKLKVRSPSSAHARATLKKVQEPYQHLLRSGKDLPEDVAETMVVKHMSQSLIMDWDGPMDGDGDEAKPVPFSVEACEKVLRDFPWFREDAGSLIGVRDSFKALSRKEDLGN